MSSSHPHQPKNLFSIDQPGSLSGTIVVLVVTRQEYQMAVPLKAPIAHTALLEDDKSPHTSKESVAAILSRCKVTLIADWLTRTKATPELNHLHLSDEQRTGHLPKLLDDIVARLSTVTLPTKDSDAIDSRAAVSHGKLRRTQRYTPGMLIHESRILQVTIFGTLHKNLSMLDFNLLLPDVMIIADEVDAQLTQTMESFTNVAPKSAKPQLLSPT
jgi:hypothetical protein